MNRDINHISDDGQDKTRLTGSPAAMSGAQTPFISDGRLQAGEIVGDSYEVIALLGVGGMGCVYSVKHRILQKIYAMKTINSELVSEVAWRRLQVEAQAMARINHPNIVAVHNLGIHQGKLPYYVMDLLQGKNLADILEEENSLSLNETIEIFLEVCAGLGFAHRKGIVHRDIKPGNIIILDKADVSGARVKLVDFGIAKLAGTSDPNNQKLTSAGEVFGSPLYMSPEQCDGKRIDARSDIYSLGCTIFETLTGRPPFRGGNPVMTMLMHKDEIPPTLSSVAGSKFPQSMENVVATLLAKAPMDRYQNLERVAADLESVLSGDFVAASPFNTHIDLGAKNDGNSEDEDEDEHDQTEQSKVKVALKSPASLALLIAAFLLMLVSVGFCVYALSPKHDQDTTTSIVKAPPPAVGTETSLTEPKLTVPKFSEHLANGDVLFTFPKDLDLGKISDKDAISARQEAVGQFKFKQNSRIYFYPSEYTIAHPELINSFGANDLYSISTPAKLERCELKEFLSYVTRLTGLARLSVQQSKVGDGDIKYLDQLPNLKSLNVSYTDITGGGLSKLKRLKKLSTLFFSCNKDTHQLIVALKGSEQLNNLYLEAADTPLGKTDAEIIAGLKNLTHLDLAATDLDDRTLTYFQNLPHLEFLDISGSGVTEAGLKKLRESYHGRKIDISCIMKTRASMQTFDNESPADWIR